MRCATLQVKCSANVHGALQHNEITMVVGQARATTHPPLVAVAIMKCCHVYATIRLPTDVAALYLMVGGSPGAHRRAQLVVLEGESPPFAMIDRKRVATVDRTIHIAATRIARSAIQLATRALRDERFASLALTNVSTTAKANDPTRVLLFSHYNNDNSEFDVCSKIMVLDRL